MGLCRTGCWLTMVQTHFLTSNGRQDVNLGGLIISFTVRVYQSTRFLFHSHRYSGSCYLSPNGHEHGRFRLAASRLACHGEDRDQTVLPTPEQYVHSATPCLELFQPSLMIDMVFS